MQTVDTRGLSCPQPVLLARKAMQQTEGQDLEILVDAEASLENVTRAAGQLGWVVEVVAHGEDECAIRLKKK